VLYVFKAFGKQIFKKIGFNPNIMENLVVIGTSHIAEQSVREVKEAFISHKPDIVAVELDQGRLNGLLSRKRTGPKLSDIRRIGLQGFLFVAIGSWLQKKLGKIVNVEPGTEMLTAIRLARKEKIKIALIDQEIEITLKRLSRAISWKEKWNFAVDMFKSIFFRKSEMKKIGIENFDLKKVPEKKVVSKLVKYMRDRYPGIHRVLVEERNTVMARNLKQIMLSNPEKKILAIVGAGHEEDIIGLINPDSESVTFQFSINTDED